MDESRRQNRWTRWRAWLAPAIAAFIGSAGGVAAQQAFLPRTATVEQRAELRRSVVEGQYTTLEQLRVLAETGLRESKLTVNWALMHVTPDGKITLRDTVSTPIPRVFSDTLLQARWAQLVAQIEQEEQLNPRVRATFQEIARMVETRGWRENVSGIKSEWGYPGVQRWLDLNRRLRAQVEALQSLEF